MLIGIFVTGISLINHVSNQVVGLNHLKLPNESRLGILNL